MRVPMIDCPDRDGIGDRRGQRGLLTLSEYVILSEYEGY